MSPTRDRGSPGDAANGRNPRWRVVRSARTPARGGHAGPRENTDHSRPRRGRRRADRLLEVGLWFAGRTAAAVVIAAVVVGLASIALADVIELTNGQRITGTVKGTTTKGLVVVVKGKERTIPQRQIRGIEFEAAEVPPKEPEPESTAALPVEPPPPPTSTRRARNPAPPRPEPDLAAVSPETLRDALRAIFELRGSALPSAPLADYFARAQEAQAAVERYAADASDGRPQLKAALTAAVRFYSFAASAWRTFDAQGDFAAVGRDPLITTCPHLRQTIEHDAAQWQFNAADPAFIGLMAGSEGIEDLWACASDKVNEAQDLLARSEPPTTPRSAR